ncbi:MAG: hypothetical protein BWY80_00853 [Firmicutes bacterium ADurb.Bin456]|nr:MAG: hypothetical protein BWY80_00853 [Firmicutes bacterium ADurb.Bin456]
MESAHSPRIPDTTAATISIKTRISFIWAMKIDSRLREGFCCRALGPYFLKRPAASSPVRPEPGFSPNSRHNSPISKRYQFCFCIFSSLGGEIVLDR